MIRKIIIAAFAVLMTHAVMAQSEMGLWMDAGVSKKIGKRWSVDAEVEYRMKDNMCKSDRLGLGIGTTFKITKGLKAQAGYNYLHSYQASATSSGGKKQYDSYWYPRHRVYVGLTGSLKTGPLKWSLRERWVYTYRPEKTVSGTKISSGAAVTKVRSGSGENVLRSRLMGEYDIRKCSVTPYASVEMYNNWDVQKIRYSLGATYNINKHHSVDLYYMYQDRKNTDSDDDVLDTHVIGLSYNYSF